MTLKIFLGDLVHTWEKASTWTFPLNIGYIASYLKKQLGDDVEVRLFKRPEKMIDAIRAERPDVVGLGFYVWNANLNKLVFDIARAEIPGVLNIGGGPNFTSINNTDGQAKTFFHDCPSCDAYVVNQGERGFAELINAYLHIGCDRDKLKDTMVAGCAVRGRGDAVHLGTALDGIRDLDEIPSPYLTGLLDEFFAEPFAPVLETNRSCPYRCTFCAWGIGTQKLSKFSEERVLAEIEYIGQRCTNAAQMFIADANFGILERDVDFARALNASHEKYRYPGHLAVQWHKSKADRVLRTAREVKKIARIGASMQSMNGQTLDAVKRRNLPLDDLVEMLHSLRSDGTDMPLVSELILGLPEETRESHIEGNRTMIDLGAEMINYNLYLLPGTEMDTAESREKYFRETGWRLMDNAFGVYDGVKVFEGQETVQATSTMSRDDLRGFRFYHFLLQFMWGGRWYYDYMKLMWNLGLHPVDLIDKLTQACRGADGSVGEIYHQFKSDHDLESFKTHAEMAEYWGRPENLQRLKEASYGKLNYAFTYKILLEHQAAFDDFLLDFTRTTVGAIEGTDVERIVDVCAELLKFGRESRVKLTAEMDLLESTTAPFRYDILNWRNANYESPAPEAMSAVYDFHVTQEQSNKLRRLLKQYKSHNPNLTLRKMTEYIKPHEFFYSVQQAAADTLPSAGGGTPLVPKVDTHDSWSYQNARERSQ